MTNETIRPELPRVDEKDLQLVEFNVYNGAIYHHQGAPFTGFVVSNRYPNGLIWSEAQHVDGEPVGWEVSYFDNGKVAYQSLVYYDMSVAFYEYDKTGEQINGGIVASTDLYNKCAAVAGIALIDENA